MADVGEMHAFTVSDAMRAVVDGQSYIDGLTRRLLVSLHRSAARQGYALRDAVDVYLEPLTRDPFVSSNYVVHAVAHFDPKDRRTPVPGYRPRLLVDFDGVLHAYSRGWHDGTAYDGPNPGAREALEELEAAGYEVVIFSTRDAVQIAAWFDLHHFPARRITNVKEPAIAIIDDRAIRFTSWAQTLTEVRDRHPVDPQGSARG